MYIQRINKMRYCDCKNEISSIKNNTCDIKYTSTLATWKRQNTIDIKNPQIDDKNKTEHIDKWEAYEL